MKEPEISVVLLTYYHEAYLARALDSILGQETAIPFEVLVADDCSGDRTVEIAREYEQKYPGVVRVLANAKNLGICANECNALVQCRGKYIVTSSGDDYWPIKDKLERQYAFLESHPDYIAETVQVEAFYTDGEPTGEITPKPQFWGREFTKADIEWGDFFCTAGIMFRNILKTPKGREDILQITKFSRDIDDLPLMFLWMDHGKIHVADYVGYAITVRRENDQNQHNFNTLYKGYKNSAAHVNLLVKMERYYQGKYNLNRWIAPHLANLICFAIRERKYSVLRDVPGVTAGQWLAGLLWQVRSSVNKRLPGRKD